MKPPLGPVTRRAALWTALAFASPCAASAAEGLESYTLAMDAPPAYRIAHGWSLGISAGSVALDGGLSDYRWDVRPHAAWGAEGLMTRGPISGGVRVWRTTTTQDLGVPGAPAAAAVSGTSLEAVLRGRLMRWGSSELTATATAGRLFLRYRPEQITLADPMGGAPLAVALSPIDEWIGGGGLGLTRGLGGPWTLETSVERRIFALDTAHRSGNAIVTGRETFGDWSARLGLSRLFGR